MSKKIFIVAVREHNYLGQILNAYFVENNKNNEFFSTVESVKGENEENLSFEQQKILNLINQFSDRELLRVFSKKKKMSTQEFFLKMEETFFEERIQPYLETRMKKILDIILKNKIPFYFRSGATIHYDDKIRLTDTKAEAIFNFIKEKDHTKYFLSIRQNGEEKSLLNASYLSLVKEPAYIIINNILYYFTDIDSNKLKPFFDKEFVRVAKSAEKIYFEKFIYQSILKYKVNAKGFNVEKMDLKPKLNLQFSTGLEGKYQFIANFQYKEHSFAASNINPRKVWMLNSDENYHFYILERDRYAEQALLSQLKDFGFHKKADGIYEVQFDFDLKSEKEYNYELINWLNGNKDKLIRNGFELIENNHLEHFYTSTINLDIKTKKENDWFDIYATVKLEGFEIPFTKLKDNILSGIREFELPNGQIIILPKVWFEKFSSIFEHSEEIMGWIQLDKHHAVLLDNIDEIDSSYLSSLQNIYNKAIEKIEVPSGLNANLRNYQHEGFSWISALMEENLGACLADDMGLGKTLQSLALIEHLYENYSVESMPKEQTQLSLFEEPEIVSRNGFLALIIMPTSLLYNWISEIQQFVRHLKVLNYTGLDRKSKFNNFKEYDIVLSTYGVIRNDFEQLSKINFDIIILDESQYIKNPGSKLYKAVENLSGQRKLVLTGTPIENSLSDLWAQMNFINPGLLGNYNYFKEHFLNPIEKKNDEQVRDKFKKLVKPFILRRSKKEVAKDLPELTQQTRYCDLSAEHLELYNKEKSKIRNFILSGETEDGYLQKSNIHILQSISKLRQLANQAELVFPDNNIESEKFNEILRVVQAIVEGDNKVLVFSSYVKILKQFEKYFKNWNIPFAKINGKMSKKERDLNVQNFQTNSAFKAFLISIKAGGVGLNLTAADYVIIIDPWWNPAVESQAINRAHRIGQKKNVVVYRFISKNTIEQKIEILQNKKRNLSQDILTLDKELRLDMDELKSLFE